MHNEADDTEENVGMKLLKQMGYKPGTGLGSREQGRIDPVSITLRPKNTGLGFIREEKKHDRAGKKEKKRSKKKRPSQDDLSELSSSASNASIDSLDEKEEQKDDFSAIIIDSPLLKSQIMSKTKESNNELEEMELKRLQHIESVIIKLEKSLGLDEIIEHSLVLRQLDPLLSDRVILSLLRPIFKGIFTNWNPTSKESLSILPSFFFKIKELNGNQFINLHEDEDFTMTISETLLNEFWWPLILNFLDSISLLKDVDSLIKLLEAWLPVIGDYFKTLILDKIVDKATILLENLDNEHVDPSISWIVPLLPFIHSSKIIWKSIRHALQDILRIKEIPQDDKFIIDLLKRWKPVMPSIEFDILCIKSIMDKLISYQNQNLIIDPSHQEMTAYKILLTYERVLNKIISVQCFKKILFPKLREAQLKWLKSESVDYEQVFHWYEAWKSIIPLDLRDDLTDELIELLELLNKQTLLL